MDLSQAEAVADLIASESAAGHAVAFRQLKGSVSRRMDELRTELIDTTALLELELDFSEEDVEFASRDRLMALLADLQTEVAQLLETFVLGQALKEGVPTALLGAPNAGKSTLLNALLREDRALVSAVPGTTRDTVEERFTAGGILFRLVDTAGIRETNETVERLGIERSQEAARRAAVQVLVVDAAVWNADPQPTLDLWAQLEEWNPQSHQVLVFNKADQEQPISPPENALTLSAATGAGVPKLETALAHWVTLNPAYGADTVVSHARHAAALRAAADSLSQAESALRTGLSGELVAIDLRDALRHIGSITGQVVADDLLSSIFSRFCIGK
jgi:tRNA modification GTPase